MMILMILMLFKTMKIHFEGEKLRERKTICALETKLILMLLNRYRRIYQIIT